MLKNWLMLCFLLAFSLPGSDMQTQLRVKREIFCSEVRTPLPADGEAAAAGWENLHWSGNFTVPGSFWGEAPVRTEVALAHDREYLYFGAKMSESQGGVLRQNDTVEMLLWKRGVKKEWLHLAVDSAGKMSFARQSDMPEMPGSCHSEELPQGNLKVGIKLKDDGWSMTAAIPLEQLRDYWGEGSRVNFGRRRGRTHGISAWCCADGLSDYNRNGIVRLDYPERTARKEKQYADALLKLHGERRAAAGKGRNAVHTHEYAFSAAGGVPGYRPLFQKYNAENGAGWLETAGINSGSLQEFIRERPAYAERLKDKAVSPLADTYLYAETPAEHTFRLDLPNGRYRIHILSGLISWKTVPHRRKFAVLAQGKEIKQFDVGHELYLKYDFPVTVADGKLMLTFRGMPEALQDNPGSLPLSAGEAVKYYRPGWLLNSIVATPSADRKNASKQIALDELEITHCSPEVLADYRRVEYSEPEQENCPESWQKRGYVLFSRPFGSQLYPESRPQPGELLEKLSLKAVAGEPVFLNFGMLPLQDLDEVQIAVDGVPLEVEESRYVSKPLGGGKYAMVPLFNDRYVNADHDFNAGENRWIWLTGRIPAEAAPGTLCGSLMIAAGEQKHSYPVEIEVLPFRVKEPDFAFGGYNPPGYNRPGNIYEDALAAFCREYDLHMHVLYLDPFRGESSWTELKNRIRLYQKNGVKGPYLVYVFLPIEKIDFPLRNRKISRLPDDVMKTMLDTAGRLLKMHKEEGFPELVFVAMDEAHCKGDPYWAEQIRLNREVKRLYPELKTGATESDRSISRIGKAVDAPILLEVDDFNAYRGYPRVYSYTNQYLLEPDDMNGGRMQCGWIPATVKLNGVVPWMLFAGTGENGFRYSIWTMIQQRGVGGYHYMPKLCTLMGTVGQWDLRYVETLKDMIAAAEKSAVPARKAAAEEAEQLLRRIREATKPSIRYYYDNGYWPPEVFNRLREIVTEQIMKLKELEEGGSPAEAALHGGRQTVAAGERWWNREWQSRVKLTLNTGMSPAEGMLASARIAGPGEKVNLSSARLVSEDGKEIPCLLKKDACGNYAVGWKPEKLKMLEKRNYWLYFSDTAKAAGEEAAGLPKHFPGMNLIPGAGFTQLDSAGHPNGWAMSSQGYGIRDKWTAANRDKMKVVTVDGRRALELSDGAVVWVRVQPDHQYRLSLEAKYEADRFNVTVWYRGRTASEFPGRKLGIDNYKMQVDGLTKGEWSRVAQSTFVYLDNKTKQQSSGNKKLLENTELALISIRVANGKAWIANICYEDITEQGTLETAVGKIEGIPPE